MKSFHRLFLLYILLLPLYHILRLSLFIFLSFYPSLLFISLFNFHLVNKFRTEISPKTNPQKESKKLFFIFFIYFPPTCLPTYLFFYFFFLCFLSSLILLCINDAYILYFMLSFLFISSILNFNFNKHFIYFIFKKKNRHIFFCWLLVG